MATKAKSKPPELPKGFQLRRPDPRDVTAIVELMNAVDLADVGEADTSVSDVEEVWGFPRFSRERDAWIVVGPDGALAGYAWVWDRKPNVEIQSDSYVAPPLARSGLEEALLARIEDRAEEHRTAAPRSERVLIRCFTSAKAAPRVEALRGRGYVHVRTFCRMTIDLLADVPAPSWPTGVVARGFVLGRDDRAADLAIQESFEDHFGYVRETHEDWMKRRVEKSEFDPGLWTVAWDGDQPAGAILAYAPDGEGWVRELGVRPPWRGRGIGKALLLHTFAILAKRGIRRVGLGVDMANETGATQLYESVGMRVAFQHDLYEKTLGQGLAS
ncbi:MAG TPA: GNAT family N-acetyltransferase [Candidatus Eisenbacteria bacterium]|jgi:ribosomal protein S18 acetylase RimI-like enzyme|nr:GNAT family N-acetyltransferase [Candidatus Eisenbacteria bacterium]